MHNPTRSKPKFESMLGRVRLGLIAAALAFSVSAIGHLASVFSAAERVVADKRLAFASRTASQEIELVAIDQESLFQLGGHPIGRDKIASVLDRLNTAGTHRIYLNLSFASEHNEEQDAHLQKALEQLGPARVALPVCLLQASGSKSEGQKEKWLEPLARFAKNVSLVDGNTLFDGDGFVRVLGQHSSANSKYSVNIAQWLNGTSQQGVGPTKIDYRIDLSSIPQTSLSTLLTCHDSELGRFRGKDIVIGITAPHVMPSISVPRMGDIQHAQLCALAAETIRSGGAPTGLGFGRIAIGTAFASLVFGLYFVRISSIASAALTLATISLYTLFTFISIANFAVELPIIFPSLTILLTFVCSQIAVHPAFYKTRMAVLTFLDKFDYRWARLFQTGLDSIVTFTPDGRIHSLNRAAEKMFGVRSEEAAGRPVSVILPNCADTLLLAASQKEPGRMETNIVQGAHSNQYLDLSFCAMPTDSSWVGYVSIRDVSESRARENALRHRASHDSMTGLPNRAAFEERLSTTHRYCSETNNKFAVMLLDLNKFKSVNDTLGHHVGDALLVEVAKRLKVSLRDSDFVARLGGDEFAVILAPPMGIEHVHQIAAKIVTSVEQVKELQGEAIQTGTSIGIAYYPDHSKAASELVRIADEAMYIAKRERTGYRVADCVPNTAPVLNTKNDFLAPV
jgi:diguanylate cyclase (GGDEF)-like protein/PAS domain S-box-containing protein